MKNNLIKKVEFFDLQEAIDSLACKTKGGYI
jgi:hypothetical protein